MAKRQSAELKVIINRKAEISALIKKLQAELAELEVAERVLLRISGEKKQAPEHVQNKNIIIPVDTPTKPDKTVAEMAISVLEIQDMLDDEGLTSRQILDEIRGRGMPQLQRTSLTAPLYRLKNAGKIVRVGRRWKLSTENKNGDQHD